MNGEPSECGTFGMADLNRNLKPDPGTQVMQLGSRFLNQVMLQITNKYHHWKHTKAAVNAIYQ